MSEKRFTIKEYDDYNYVAFNEEKPMIHLQMKAFGTYAAFHKIIDLLNEQYQEIQQLNKLAEFNEEQTLNIMTYLHDNHYEIWEEVNQKCFGDVND